MSSEKKKTSVPAQLTIQSSRFGEMAIAADSVIEFPQGLIGFPEHRRYVMFDHKAPFAWLHSTEDKDLAFVVIDGSRFAAHFDMPAPFNNRETDLKEDDEYAILIVVTVRSDPKLTTANLKAPLFVNLRNRKGTQIIYDDPKYPTRHSLWSEEDAKKTDDVKK